VTQSGLHRRVESGVSRPRGGPKGWREGDLRAGEGRGTAAGDVAAAAPDAHRRPPRAAERRGEVDAGRL